jgi:hypothetical protein
MFKRFILFNTVTIFLSIPLMPAQSAVALYKTEEDFISNRPSFIKGKNNCKIRIRDFSYNSRVKVTYGKSILRLSKDSLYGYKNNAGVFYRFYKKKIYQCLNPSENILLYKVRATIGGKYQPATYTYYFSKNAYSPILLLTINNVENSFEGQNKFLMRLGGAFKYDSDLLEYDYNFNLYKINRLLQLSEGKNN